MTHSVRIRRDVRLVPMVNLWYATPFLVPPHTFGLMTLHSHLPLLRSFVEDPETHRRCASNPALRGGPFVAHEGDEGDVADFIPETERNCADALALAREIEDVFRVVGDDAKGAGLQGLYAKTGESLSGAVEFVYDVCKQPGVRFIEPVLYDGVDMSSLQGCRLEPVSAESRPFVLSTPLLDRSDASVDIRAPFGSDLWDTIFARDGNHSEGELVAMVTPHLADPRRDVPLFVSMLEAVGETSAPSLSPPSVTSDVRIRYFGHACVLIEAAEKAILVDPLVGYGGESTIDGYTFYDLPDWIDYVLITHVHADHLVLETLLQIRHKIGRVIVGRASAGNLADVSPRLLLKSCGFRDVVELGEYDRQEVGDGFIMAAPFYGEHGDLDIRSKSTFGISLGKRSIVLLADSNPPDAKSYRGLLERMGRVDCLFLGMECVGAPVTWAYGPLLRRSLTRQEDQSRRLNGSDADRAIELIDYFLPDFTFVYAMGAEPWVTHISSIVASPDLPQFVAARQLVDHASSVGLHAELLYLKRELVLEARIPAPKR